MLTYQRVNGGIQVVQVTHIGISWGYLVRFSWDNSATNRQTPGIESGLVTPVISVGAMFVCDWGCNPLTNWVGHQYAINGDLLGIRVGYFRGRLDSLDGV